MDDVPDTITIITDMFSSYAIAYRLIGGADTVNGKAECGLCHICPTFLGICCFIWLAAIAVIVFVVVIMILGKKKMVKT